jgi:hypothetical protein
MIRFSIDYQGFPRAIEQVHALAYRLFDLRPLAATVAEIMREQNALTRAAGLDQYGVPFVDLAPSTWRKRERQGRMGPPLSPDGASSPITTDFRADVEVFEPDDVLVRGHWPTLDWVRFHVDSGGPRTRLPVRDPGRPRVSGLRLPGRERLLIVPGEGVEPPEPTRRVSLP